MKKTDKSYFNWYFLGFSTIIYIIFIILNKDKSNILINETIKIINSILPILLIIFILMALTNYFISDKLLLKYMGKNSGIKGWIFAIIGGILSAGPGVVQMLSNEGVDLIIAGQFGNNMINSISTKNIDFKEIQDKKIEEIIKDLN